MKNSGNEAKRYSKTKEGRSKTKLKRTAIECEMRTLNVEIELSNAARALAGKTHGQLRQGSKLSG